MGGGRFTNILGTDAKIVFDWEGYLERLPHAKFLSAGGKLAGILMGIGGDTSVIGGNKNTFQFSGDIFSATRNTNPVSMACKYNGDSVNTCSYWIFGCGILALFAGTLSLHYAGQLYDKKNANVNIQHMACLILPILEARWLWLLKLIEIISCIIDPLESSLNEANSKKSPITSQLKDVEQKIAAAELSVSSITISIKRTAENIGPSKDPKAMIAYQKKYEAYQKNLESAKETLSNWTARKLELEEKHAEKITKVLEAQQKLESAKTGLGA